MVVTGMGVVGESSYGSVFRRQSVRYGVDGVLPPWKQATIFPVPLKNAGRFDPVTRRVISACALALQDAGRVLGNAVKSNVGLLGGNPDGCVEANRAYFADYLAGGRALARANLFVYTLPTSPLAEVAIHFGLQGPVMYIGCPGTLKERLADLVETGVAWLRDQAAEAMLVVANDEHSAVAAYIGRGTGAAQECGVDAFKTRWESESILSEGINL